MRNILLLAFVASLGSHLSLSSQALTNGQPINIKAHLTKPVNGIVKLNVPSEKPGYKFENKHFHSPEVLIADGIALNKKIRQGYLSPSLQDIDKDGKVELLTGDVAGKVRVYRNNSDDGLPEWSDDGFLKNIANSAIIAKNW